MMVKARGSERENACPFTRKLLHGDKNDWLLKERVHVSGDQLCGETTKAYSIHINNIMP